MKQKINLFVLAVLLSQCLTIVACNQNKMQQNSDTSNTTEPSTVTQQTEKAEETKTGQPIIYSDHIVVQTDQLVEVRDYLITQGWSNTTYSDALDSLLSDVNYTPGMGSVQVSTPSLYYNLYNKYEALVLGLNGSQRDALNDFVNNL